MRRFSEPQSFLQIERFIEANSLWNKFQLTELSTTQAKWQLTKCPQISEAYSYHILVISSPGIAIKIVIYGTHICLERSEAVWLFDIPSTMSLMIWI